MVLAKKKLLLLLCLSLILLNWTAVMASDGFVFKDLNGVSHHLKQYKGRWVVVNYWATWCPPCLEEIPDLVSLYDARNEADLMVIGIVIDYESVDAVAAYIDDMLMSYPVVLGDDAVIKQVGPADALPTTYIYNPLGKLVKVKRGIVSRQYLETIMQHY